MTRRLSLAGQLLALQVVIICVVLVGVTAVTVAQSTKRRRSEIEGRRAQAVAETLANSRALRDAVADGEVAYVRVAAETTRTNSGSASVVVARPDRARARQRRPQRAGPALRRRRQHRAATVAAGWGSGDFNGSPAAVAMAPILDGPRREIAGFVAVTRLYPTVARRAGRAAAPNLLTYLGLASVDRHRRARCWWPAG